MDVHDVPPWFSAVAHEVGAQFQRIPGSAIFLRYVRSSYQNDPVRSAVELFLFLFFVRYLLAPKYSTQNKGYVKLSDEVGMARCTPSVFVGGSCIDAEFSVQEIDELVDEWTPEPLLSSLTASDLAETEKRPVIVGPTGPKTKLSTGRVVTNLASYNMYNFVGDEDLKEKAIQTLRTYGVGPCGPPGFYGTQDVHIRAEADIATFLGTSACIVYAQAFSTISSVIPAFSKRGDIIVADEAINYAARRGIQISRSSVRWFKHNDANDLERVLKEVVKEQSGKPLTRRFIVTEGLSEHVGDEVDLARVVDLKFRYKFRLILDETSSFGVLGRTGRGVTEAQNVDVSDVDMIVASLAGALCAAGGFCAGSDAIVEHQRITSAAYTFSAALPAMLATAASEALIRLQTDPDLIGQLQLNVRAMRAQLDPRSEWVCCTSSVSNPIMLLVLKPALVSARAWTVDDQDRLLQDVVDETLANGVLITHLKRIPSTTTPVGRRDPNHWQPSPALKVCVTVGLSRKEIEKAGVIIRHAITKVVSRRK